MAARGCWSILIIEILLLSLCQCDSDSESSDSSEISYSSESSDSSEISYSTESSDSSERSENDVAPCHDMCTQWQVCVEFGRFEECYDVNECDPLCAENETCCGHNHCYCIWPRIEDSTSSCRDCVCPLPDETCTIDGACVCGDNHIRVDGQCVECDPTITCPDCDIYDLVCAIPSGDTEGMCVCPPRTVLSGDTCVDCIPCPEECPPGQICVTYSNETTSCSCPPDTRDDGTGKCIPCPACPDCDDGYVCVIRGGIAACECPGGTVESWNQCVPIAVCPECEDFEVCVIPDTGSPYCACEEDKVAKNGACVPCFVKDDCESNHDCTDGQVCVNGLCECPTDYIPKWGKCIPPGHPGGICDFGKCYGNHAHCGQSHVCECHNYCYKDPQPTCIPKKKRW